MKTKTIKKASQNLTRLICIFLSMQMILMPIVSAAEEIEQMAPPESEQSVSSDSHDQDSEIATEEAENKSKSVDEKPKEGTEEKNPDDENKNPDDEKPENEILNNPDDDSIHKEAIKEALSQSTKPHEYKTRGKLKSDLFTGAANYTYTIESPPGRNGLQPTVSLSYSSMGAKGVAGIAGVGWNLNLSYVQRNVNYTYRDTEIDDDKFELYLFGSKIDLVPDTSGNLIGKYRGKNNPSLYVEASDNNSDNKIDQWIVKQPDGTKLFFGIVNGEDCRITNNFQNRNYTSRWYLKKIQDTQKTPNEIYYNYLDTISGSANIINQSTPKPDINQKYLTSIEYNNNKNRKILFKYEARPDIIMQFRQGLQVQQSYRLHSIETIAAGNRINRWQMEYVDDIRSYLEKIHEAPTDAKKYTTSFGYKRGWPELGNPDNKLKAYNISKPEHQFAQGRGDFFRAPYYERHDHSTGGLYPKGYIKNIRHLYSYKNYPRIPNPPPWQPDDSNDSTLHAYGFKQMYYSTNAFELFKNKYVDIDGTQFNVLGFFQSCESYIQLSEHMEGFAHFAGKYIDIDGDGSMDLVASCYKKDTNQNSSPPVNYNNQNDSWVVFTNFPAQILAGSYHAIVWNLPDDNFVLPVTASTSYISSGDTYSLGEVVTFGSLIDMNGDGLPDIVRSTLDRYIDSYHNNTTLFVYYNTGSSFGNTNLWQLPDNQHNISFTKFQKSHNGEYNHTYYGLNDINADGLPDYVYETDSNGEQLACAWNSGSCFLKDSQILSGVYFHVASHLEENANAHILDTKFFDFNNDGFLDYIRYDKYYSPDFHTQFSVICPAFETNNNIIYNGNSSVRLFDDNNIILEIYTEPAGSLMTITNEIGGVSSINYEESLLDKEPFTYYDQDDGIVTNDYPIYDIFGPNTRIWRVKEIITENGMTKNDETVHPHYNKQKTEYKYGKVWQDHKEHDYRGHDWVEETVSGENDKKFKTKHYFHQDDYRKGKEYRTLVYDKYDEVNETANLLRETENTFSVYDKTHTEILTDPATWMETPENQYFATFLTDTRTKFHETSSIDTERETKSTYEYDIYGNVKKEIRNGDISHSKDDLEIKKNYSYNTEKWIVNKPYYLRQRYGGVYFNKTYIHYDNQSFQQAPTRGNLTRLEKWWEDHENPVTTATYDDYGNMTSVTDPNGNASYTFYDTETHTFPERSVNALNHETEILDFDRGTGQPKKAIDSNGLESHFDYDAFHRVTETRTEFAGELLGKTVYTYSDYQLPFLNPDPRLPVESHDAIPAGTKTAVLLTGNTWTEAYKYIDGNGNAIQTRTAAEGGKHLVSETFYNERGLAYKQPVPFFATKSDGGAYAEPTGNDINGNSVGFTETEFDALQRPTKTITPEGYFTTTEYGLSAIANTEFAYTKTTNPRNVPIKHYSDARGNLVKVEEFHSIDFAFFKDFLPQSHREHGVDSTFSKGGEGDFDVFTTIYTYDPLGQLKTIKDEKKNTWSFRYDTLGNRIYADDPDRGISLFEYDPAGNLIRTTDARSAINELDYDALNRITERRNEIPLNKGGEGVVLTTKLHYDKDPNNSAVTKIGLLNKVEYGKFNTQNSEFNIQCTKALEYDTV